MPYTSMAPAQHADEHAPLTMPAAPEERAGRGQSRDLRRQALQFPGSRRRAGMWIAAGALVALALLAFARGGAPQPPHHRGGGATVLLVDQVPQASESLGVSAAEAHAEALHDQVEDTADRARSLEKAVRNQLETAGYLEAQAAGHADRAKAMLTEAASLRGQAREETASAEQIRDMAANDMAAAAALEKQADNDLSNLKKLTTSASNEDIRKVAEEQREVAKDAKQRAALQIRSAKKMEAEAKVMKDKADEELRAARLVNETARNETAAAREIRKQAAALNAHIKSVAAMKENITSSSEDVEALADKLDAKVQRESASMTESAKTIADARASLQEANRQELRQNHSLHDAQATYNASQKEVAVAKSMLGQLDRQMDNLADVSGMADGTQDSRVFTDLFHKQTSAAEDSKDDAVKEATRAEALGKKALASAGVAEDARAKAKALAVMAQKTLRKAQAVQAAINAPTAISEDTQGQIRVMMDGAAEASAALKAINEALRMEREAFRAAKSYSASEASAGQALAGQASGIEDDRAAKALGRIAAVERNASANLTAAVEQKEAAITELETLSKTLGDAARELEASARAREDKAFAEAYDRRLCMDLPGVRMTGEARDFERLVGQEEAPASAKECAAKCRRHVDCRQSVFVQENNGCYLMRAASTVVSEFTDGYNSSFCGESADKDEMLRAIDKVYAQKPWVPPVVQCSWADEDCSQTKCCNNVQCDWKFNCKSYQCYKKDDTFAGCKLSPPGGWQATPLGGGRQLREIGKAKEGILVQGTSLFCFSVVMWHNPPAKAFYDSEADLANNWRSKGLGIMRCDDHLILDGKPAPMSTWGSFSNIDAFIQIWDEVKQDGRWRQHDWIVKVDTDAVFFPHRLRMHLSNLRTPQGSLVYLKNNAYRFQFMGALEIMTRQALAHYYAHEERCAVGGGGHSGGEDFYMMSCLNGLGVDHQSDFGLLHDRYAAQEGCADAWAAAFHFYKKVSSWNLCHQKALDVEGAANPGAAVVVAK